MALNATIIQIMQLLPPGVGAAAPLEGLAPGEWACFERALVVRDIFTGGVRTFLSRDDARAFRSQIYAQHGASPRGGGGGGGGLVPGRSLLAGGPWRDCWRDMQSLIWR